MRYIITLAFLITSGTFGAYKVMKYNDCASTNVTTGAWVTCATATRHVNNVSVLNNGNADLIVCLAYASTECDTTNQLGLAQGFGFAKDDFPAATNIFLKSQSGTCSSGVVSCDMWRSDK